MAHSRKDKLSFRSATVSDIPLLAEWNLQLIQDEGHRNPMGWEELEERMRHWLRTSYKAIIFSTGGNDDGYLLYREYSDKTYIRQLFVDRQRRRQGIGRQAVARFLEDLRPPGKRLTVEVLAANQAGIDFWRSTGFSDYCLELEMPA